MITFAVTNTLLLTRNKAIEFGWVLLLDFQEFESSILDGLAIL